MNILNVGPIPFRDLPDAGDEQLRALLDGAGLPGTVDELEFMLCDVDLDELGSQVARTEQQWREDHVDDDAYQQDFGPDPKGDSWQRILQLRDAYRRGEQVTPIVLYQGDGLLWRADGYHRMVAAHLVGVRTVRAYVTLTEVPAD